MPGCRKGAALPVRLFDKVFKLHRRIAYNAWIRRDPRLIRTDEVRNNIFAEYIAQIKHSERNTQTLRRLFCRRNGFFMQFAHLHYDGADVIALLF